MKHSDETTYISFIDIAKCIVRVQFFNKKEKIIKDTNDLLIES